MGFPNEFGPDGEIEYVRVIQAGSLKFNLRDLARFLVDAKRTCYAGGMEPKFWGGRKTAKDTFAFLKKALSKVSVEKPFRGPEPRFAANGLLYLARTEGDITRFKGTETIGPDAALNEFSYFRLFTQDYIGGVVIPK